ncbi:hypothetical protein [Nocardia sp. NPDC051570]|uniref:hypothetical protein n=1 Tax=Nocardia sp. NPDC051570 TaxID=3364324 RepID=UPI0037A3EA75
MVGVEPTETHDDLRDILNRWDPIGVADLVDDEYDCLIAPLLSRLNTGAGRAEIGEFLRHELADHFGLSRENRGVNQVADRLVAWWVTARA